MQIIKVFLREISSYVYVCHSHYIAIGGLLKFLFWVLKMLGVLFGIQYITLQMKWSCDSEAQVWVYFGWKTQTLESLFEFHPLEQRRAICIGNKIKEFYKFIWCLNLKLPEIRNGSQPISLVANYHYPFWWIAPFPCEWNKSQIVPDMVQLMCWYLEVISWYI